MRKLIAGLFLAATAAVVTADDAKKAENKGEKVAPPTAKKKEKEKEVSLKVGDPAPALKAGKWLQNDEVKAFAAGKVYVVEFWATWCGPCIVMMPHLGEMQAEYKEKGVTFIGYTKADESNTAEKVAAFVKKRGPKLGYTFAFSESPDTYEAWMTAAGQGGIPCSFVVDKEGKIAYIGHPMYLDEVLPKVVAGTWKAAESGKELDAVENEVTSVFKSLNGDPETGLRKLAEFESKHPDLAKIPYFVAPKLSMTLKLKKYDDACLLARNLINRGSKTEDEMMLGQVSTVLTSEAKERKDIQELALKAANAALKVAGDKDLRALLGVARAHNAAGDKAKAREYGKKAVEAADPQFKAQVEKIVKEFDDAKEGEKKGDEKKGKN